MTTYKEGLIDIPLGANGIHSVTQMIVRALPCKGGQGTQLEQEPFDGGVSDETIQ